LLSVVQARGRESPDRSAFASPSSPSAILGSPLGVSGVAFCCWCVGVDCVPLRLCLCTPLASEILFVAFFHAAGMQSVRPLLVRPRRRAPSFSLPRRTAWLYFLVVLVSSWLIKASCSSQWQRGRETRGVERWTCKLCGSLDDETQLRKVYRFLRLERLSSLEWACPLLIRVEMVRGAEDLNVGD